MPVEHVLNIEANLERDRRDHKNLKVKRTKLPLVCFKFFFFFETNQNEKKSQQKTRMNKHVTRLIKSIFKSYERARDPLSRFNASCDDSDDIEYFERLASRILNSRFYGKQTYLMEEEDEVAVIDRMQRKMKKRSNANATAYDLLSLIERLKRVDNGFLRRKEVLEFLVALANDCDGDGEDDDGIKFDSPDGDERRRREKNEYDGNKEEMRTPRARERVERLLNETNSSSAGASARRRREQRRTRNNNENATLNTMARALTPRNPKASLMQQQTMMQTSPKGGPRDDAYNQLAKERRRNNEVAESQLVRDCIFASNGIDGTFVKFDVVNDAYVISPVDAPIAPGRRHACRKICELGWLYKKVKACSDKPNSQFAQDTEGATRSAFRSALSNELSNHYKLLAVLEAKVQNNDDDLNEDDDEVVRLVGEDDEEDRRTLMSSFDRSFDSFAPGGSRRNMQISRNHNKNNDISDRIAPRGDDVVTLRRLIVWLEEPKRAMRSLAILCDAVENLRGGSLLAELYKHTDTGDVAHDAIARKILSKAAKPYFQTLKEWCARGESSLEESGKTPSSRNNFGEFFVRKNDKYYRHRNNSNNNSMNIESAKMEEEEAVNRWYRFDSEDEILDDGHPSSSSSTKFWKSGYVVDESAKPFFISNETADDTLKCGAAISFLRNSCKDERWSDVSRDILKHLDEAIFINTEETNDSFEMLVKTLPEIISSVKAMADRAVRESLFDRFRLKAHFVALKQYLLLGQGDFIHALMESVHDELDKEIDPMSREGISQYSLRGNLDTAIRVSNATFAEQNVIDALNVRLMKPLEDETGWDVFSLEYRLTAPLTTIFSDREMGRYSRAFTFLWKLKRAEYTLCELWKSMKPTISSRLQREGLSGEIGKALDLEQSRCQKLRHSMHALITDVQYYVMFEVLEPSWNEFERKLDEAGDLDSIIAGHENYLNSVIEKALLGTKSQVLQRSLQLIFESIQNFKAHTSNLYNAMEDAAQVKKSDQRRIIEREMNEQWGVDFGESKDGENYLSEDFVVGARESLDGIEIGYEKSVDGFLKLLPLATHVDTSFLSFRLERSG